MNEVAAVIGAEIPRYLTAIAEWGACMVYIVILGRRRGIAASAGLSVAGLGALILVQWWAGTLPIAFWIPGMLLAAATMYALVLASLRLSPRAAGYLTARAFVLAELTASVYWQLDFFYGTNVNLAVRTGIAMVFYALVFILAWAVERLHLPRGGRIDVSGKELIGTLAIAGATFAISNLSFVSGDNPFSGRYGPEIGYIRTLVDLAGYIALYVQHRVHNEAQLRRDADAMSHLLRSQHEQYQLTRRSIDEMNRKYHDMKHHLDALRAEEDPAARSRMVDAVEDSIRGYGAMVNSGNHVLDAVLTAKRARADELGIDVSYVADGRLLEFVRPLDLTSIVGNALDNAIEATIRLADRDQRMVRLALFAQDDFVMLRVENTYDGIVVREGDRILTRHTGEGHGYGLRNIETAVAGYDGTVSITTDPRWFTLLLLFPRV